MSCIVGSRGQDWWKKKPEESVMKKRSEQDWRGCMLNGHNTVFKVREVFYRLKERS